MIEKLRNTNISIPKSVIFNDLTKEIKKDSEHTESLYQNNYTIDDSEIEEKKAPKKKITKTKKEISKLDVRSVELKDYEDDPFIQLPRWLLDCDLGLGLVEKVMYVILSDRYKLSLTLERKNYRDKELNRTFELYSKKELAKMLGIGLTRCNEAYDKLVKVGLIEIKKQGPYRPNRIFVNRITDQEIINKKNGNRRY